MFIAIPLMKKLKIRCVDNATLNIINSSRREILHTTEEFLCRTTKDIKLKNLAISCGDVVAQVSSNLNTGLVAIEKIY